MASVCSLYSYVIYMLYNFDSYKEVWGKSQIFIWIDGFLYQDLIWSIKVSIFVQKLRKVSPQIVDIRQTLVPIAKGLEAWNKLGVTSSWEWVEIKLDV